MSDIRELTALQLAARWEAMVVDVYSPQRGAGLLQAATELREWASWDVELKVGDRVRCIHPDRTFMTEGAVYEVEEVRVLMGNQVVGLNFWHGHLWGAWRFEREAAS